MREAIQTFDTIRGQLCRIARMGMELYVGTKNKNYVAVDDTTE
jgi:hypothetical protein